MTKFTTYTVKEMKMNPTGLSGPSGSLGWQVFRAGRVARVALFDVEADAREYTRWKNSQEQAA